MRIGQPFCLYANPVRPLLLMLGALGFTVAGVWMLRDAHASANPFNVVGAWVAIVLFGGLGIPVFLLMIGRDVILRRPILRIDQQRWWYRRNLALFGDWSDSVDWHDIDYIGVCREPGWQSQRGTRRNRKYRYYLVAHAKDDPMDPDTAAQKSYNSTLGDGVAVPLDFVFLHTTPKKAQGILQRIVAQYSLEMQLHGVEVDNELHDVGDWLLL
jgi:hypothetical protein